MFNTYFAVTLASKLNLKVDIVSSDSNKPSFTDWIAVERYPDFRKARPIGILFGFMLFLLGGALVIGGIASLIHFLAALFDDGADHEAIRNLGLVVAAVLGAPFVFWRAIIAQKQAYTAEQSHITDQINKAVSGLGTEKTIDRIGRPIKLYLGNSHDLTHLVKDLSNFTLAPRSKKLSTQRSNFVDENFNEFDGFDVEVRTWDEEETKIEWQGRPLQIADGHAIAEVGDWSVFSETLPNLEVRVGAIYALERIAQDSARDHIQIMEILSAYIRENAPVRNLDPSEEPFDRARPRTDIQAALDVIGRRPAEHVALEHSKRFRLDLRKVDLSGANFSKGNFEGAIFFGSRLEGSIFRSANLRAARLQGSLLNFADFFDSDLRGALLDHAIINRLDTLNGSFTLARNTRGLSLAGADLSAISHLPVDDRRCPTFGTKDTKLKIYIEEKRNERKEDIENFNYYNLGIDIEDENGVRERLQKAGFLYWSPFDSNDLSTNNSRNSFWEDFGFKGFPFDDS